MAKDGVSEKLEQRVRSHIRAYPDFPVPGVMFRDIMPILKNPTLVHDICLAIANECKKSLKQPVHAVAALEARGFIFGPQIAFSLNVPFVTIRKKGKLPGETVSIEYAKEYGTDVMEMQKDAVTPDANVLIFDDVLATGGTMAGAIELVKKSGARVVGTYCIIELKDLKGREKLPSDIPFNYLIDF